MHEARAWIGAEAEKANGPGGLCKGGRIVVRHGVIKRRAQHVLGGRCPTYGAVVAGAAARQPPTSAMMAAVRPFLRKAWPTSAGGWEVRS